MNIPELYVVVSVNYRGEITGYPMGGGSSTKPSVKAHKSYESAKRSARYFNAEVAKVTGLEIVKEAE